MFDANVFKNRLAQQLADFGLVCNFAWELAPNIFTAQLKEPDDNEWVFIFYYDFAETMLRDSRLIDRRLSLFMVGGVTHGALSRGKDDSVRVTHFAGNLLGDIVENPVNALNIATQLFVGKDGAELAWFDRPKQMDVSQITVVAG